MQITFIMPILSDLSKPFEEAPISADRVGTAEMRERTAVVSDRAGSTPEDRGGSEQMGNRDLPTKAARYLGRPAAMDKNVMDHTSLRRVSSRVGKGVPPKRFIQNE